jgi:hypothetical protein
MGGSSDERSVGIVALLKYEGQKTFFNLALRAWQAFFCRLASCT